MAKQLVIGLAAHVDAGKTTLSEAMLYLSGAVRRQGRVDHGDTWLDTGEMEKERGITIFSKEARLTWKKTDITLIDTPGHADFSGEAERAVSVMDAAVLVISAPEGVQPHTRSLWNILRENGVPVIFFLNKTDQFQGSREELLASLRRELADPVVPFPDPDPERIALCDERCLDVFLREGEIPDRMIHSLVASRRLFPCFSGAALRNEGVTELLDFLAALDLGKQYPVEFGARVYKVARDARNARLVFMKITGGVLKARDML
ncbi:MAG: GTP-binding protein, partial [Clostridia bacterium]|nr:GTP-binding protein [Clostridia bacterium]